MGNRFFLVSQQGNNNITAFLSTVSMTLGSFFLGQIPISYVLLKVGLNRIEYSEKVAEVISYPVFFSLIMLQFVLAFITLLFCVWVLHRRKPLTLFTGFASFNWKNFILGVLATSFLFVLVSWLSYQADPSDFIWQFNPDKFYPFLTVALLLFPIQIAFEEVFVRGYLMQFTAAKTKSILVAWVITSLIFGSIHIMNQEITVYGVGKMLSVYTITGLALGYTVIKTEGLELAIGFHLINNLSAALFKTYPGSSLNTPAIFNSKPIEGINVFSSIIPAVLMVILVSIIYRKKSNKTLFTYLDATKISTTQSK